MAIEAQVTTAPPDRHKGQGGHGLERRFAKLTRRIRLLEAVIEKLDARCALQEAMIAKFKQRESQWKRSKVCR